LVHKSGKVSCAKSNRNNWSYWGCGTHGSVGGWFSVGITKEDNTPLFPHQCSNVKWKRGKNWFKLGKSN